MRGLSVVIIAFNEAANIGRCIASVAGVADEVLVVDSGSVDDTVSIATGMGARVITQPFSGHIGQKNFAADNARHDWVLSLDADEALSDKLKEEIVAWKQQDNDTVVAYSMPRLTNYCGQWIKHCGWYPDVKTRLFNRKAGNWQGKNPHDRWAPADEAAVTEKLKGDILHYSYYTLSDHLRQIEKFTEIMARDAVAAGKTCSILKVTLAPKWRFVQDYLLRRRLSGRVLWIYYL